MVPKIDDAEQQFGSYKWQLILCVFPRAPWRYQAVFHPFPAHTACPLCFALCVQLTGMTNLNQKQGRTINGLKAEVRMPVFMMSLSFLCLCMWGPSLSLSQHAGFSPPESLALAGQRKPACQLPQVIPVCLCSVSLISGKNKSIPCSSSSGSHSMQGRSRGEHNALAAIKPAVLTACPQYASLGIREWGLLAELRTSRAGCSASPAPMAKRHQSSVLPASNVLSDQQSARTPLTDKLRIVSCRTLPAVAKAAGLGCFSQSYGAS